MKRTAKFISLVLSVLMLLSLVPVVAFANAADENDRVAGWKANYQLFIDTILDNSNYTSWNYWNDNSKNLNTTYDVYTAFALYDSAWRNYATKEVTVANAEKILLALIEKADYQVDDGYVDEIVSALKTASDVNDFIQKVNKYADIELFKSSGWSTTFKIVDTAIDVANAYQKYRDKFAEAYGKVISLQMANAYYVDMLQYIANNSEYSILRQAAEGLIEKMTQSVEDVVKDVIALAAADYTEQGAELLINYAMNSNVYTAVALKVYNGATSVANFLWNTGATANLIDTLKSSYYFQADIAAWTDAALKSDDADKAEVAVDLLINAREVCEQVLYNLKAAESEGAIGKIKNQLYGTVYEDTEINIEALHAMHAAMFDKDVANFKKVVRAIYAYCPVDVQILKADNSVVYTIKDGRVVSEMDADSGIYVSFYSQYANDYLKIAYLYEANKVRLSGTANGTVTLIMDVLNDDGTVSDWSFTDRAVAAGTKIVFDTAFDGTPYYLASDTDAKTYFNDEFVPSEHPEVSAQDVANAVINVGKKEAKSFADMIREFFQKLFASLANIFKRK